MTNQKGMNRRQFNTAVAATAAAVAALPPFGIVRAQGAKLKVGVLLPRSGFQGLIGQSCQKGADLAPGVIKNLLGVDIELMNADTETNVDTARTRAERLIQEGAHVLVGPVRFRRRRGDRAGRRAARRAVHRSTSPPRRRSPSRATSSCSATSRPRSTSRSTAWR